MSDQATCGTGLAAHAELPDTVAAWLSSMAGVLDTHQQALDLTDDAARPEFHTYVTLVQELRGVAAQVSAIAARMRAAHDLPMGHHDEARMSAPAAIASFEQLVETERKLVSVLTRTLSEHEAMLQEG